MYGTLLQSDTLQSHGCAKEVTSPGGFDLGKKTKDLSSSEREERGYGEGVCVCATLLQSDTVQSYGCVKEDTRPGGVGLRQKPKDLSGSESEEGGHGEGRDVYATLLQSDTVQPYFFVDLIVGDIARAK